MPDGLPLVLVSDVYYTYPSLRREDPFEAQTEEDGAKGGRRRTMERTESPRSRLKGHKRRELWGYREVRPVEAESVMSSPSRRGNSKEGGREDRTLRK